MSEISTFFGKRIRELRTIKHMSQEELAYRASISPSYLGQIERALKSPTLETIYQLAGALDITISELFSPHINSDNTPSDLSVNIGKINIALEKTTPQQQKNVLKMLHIVSHFNQD